MLKTSVDYSCEPLVSTLYPPPSTGDSQCSPEAMFMCPDWRMPRKKPKIESIASVLRKIVLPHLLARQGIMGGRSSNGLRYHTVPNIPGRTCECALDLEATLERIIPSIHIQNLTGELQPVERDAIMVRCKPEPRVRLLVMLDTSMSMSGPSGMCSALVGSVLARHCPSGQLALVVFHSEPELVIRFGERLKPLQAAYRVMKSPVGGITNIADALKLGLAVIQRSGRKETHAVLITDGERTAGVDPRDLASRFRKLHVALVGKRNLEWGKEIACLGNGYFNHIDDPDRVPSAVLLLMQQILRT
ncbi:MAG: vWA domain-containing protein [Desulfomonilaceae bacterium]